MKRQLLSLIVLQIIFFHSGLLAQNLENFTLIAHYTLIDTDVDATGSYEAIGLKNAPFQGNDGVYSNGNYIGSDPDSCEIKTPLIPELDFTQFAYSVEFKIDDMSEGKPLIMGGSSWRWSGVYFNSSDSTLSLVYNGRISSDQQKTKVSAGDWHSATVQYQYGSAVLFLNGNKIDSVAYDVESTDSDKRLINYHGGMGKTFKGNWRNLKIYNPESTSIDNQFNTHPEISVYPNPFASEFTISNLHSMETQNLIEVYNMTGKRVVSRICSRESVQISLSNQPAGVYLLLINNQAIKRLIKK